MVDILKRVLLRIWGHLTRTKARAGWLLAAVAVTGYFLAENNQALQDFFLVVAGVAAGAVFLPELSGDLWTMSAEQVRMTMPESRIAKLQRTLIDARCSRAGWADLVWTQGLAPLLDAELAPDQVIWDQKYDITVHLDSRIISGSRYHRIETLSRGRRHLPPARMGRYCVSVTRTEEALRTEFAVRHCLARELVTLPGIDPSQWRGHVATECYVRVSINGSDLPAQLDESDGLLDVARWYFDVPDDDLADKIVPYTLQVDFVVPATEQKFPVILSGYYSAGTTEVSFRLDDRSEERQLAYASFMGNNLMSSSGELQYSSGHGASTVIFATPRESLLWPGSGILFDWQGSHASRRD